MKKIKPWSGRAVSEERVRDRDDPTVYPDADKYAEIRAVHDPIGVGLAREALSRGLGDDDPGPSLPDEELEGLTIRETPKPTDD